MAADATLASTLRGALKKPIRFAFIANGTDGTLLADKKKVAPKDAIAAKAELGGGTIFKGRCIGEDGTLVFEVSKKPPATLATLIKKTIKKAAGLAFPVEVRVAGDLEEEDEGEEGEVESKAPADAPPAPAPPNPAKLKFATKLKTLMPVMQKAEATGTEPAKAAKAQIAEGNKLFSAKQYDQALAALGQAETLLKQALIAAAKPKAAAPAPSRATSPDAARFAARLKAIAPAMQKAVATGAEPAKAAKVQIGEANKLYISKEYEQANAALDQAEALIKQALTVAAKGAEPKASAAPAPPPAKSATEDAALQAEWENRVMAIEERVLEAQKTRKGEAKWMTLFMTVQDLGGEGNFTKALEVLDKLEALLNAKSASAPADNGKLVQYRQCLLRWDKAKKDAASAVAELQKKIVDEFPDMADEVGAIQEVMGRFNGDLEDRINAAMNEADEAKRGGHNDGALKIVRDYQRYLMGDARIRAIDDDNPFETRPVGEPLLDALSELAGWMEV